MWELNLVFILFDIYCCLAKERALLRVDAGSKYPEKHSVTLVKNENGVLDNVPDLTNKKKKLI